MEVIEIIEFCLVKFLDGKDIINTSEVFSSESKVLEISKKDLYVERGKMYQNLNVEMFMCRDFQKACEQKNAEAEILDKMLQPLHSALFIESNPSPVKYAASLLGMCDPSVRLPLVEIREETKKKVSEALKVAKLL